MPPCLDPCVRSTALLELDRAKSPRAKVHTTRCILHDKAALKSTMLNRGRRNTRLNKNRIWNRDKQQQLGPIAHTKIAHGTGHLQIRTASSTCWVFTSSSAR